MAEQYAPIAKDESFNTTDLTPKNIADVLKDGLQNIADSVKPTADEIPFDPTGTSLVSTDVEGAIKEVNGKLITKTTNTYDGISADANTSTWVGNIGLVADKKVYSITTDNSNCMCYMATAGVNVQLYVRNFASVAQTVNITVNALN